MSVEAESIARRFHEAYERLAPTFGYETRQASRVPWRKVPLRNRKLMVAVVDELLAAGTVRPPATCGRQLIPERPPCPLPEGHTGAHQ